MNRLNLFIKRNAPTILTFAGAAGVVSTAVMAAKATTKATRMIDNAREKKGEELTGIEVARASAPAYIPTVLMGTSTIICIFGANVLNKRYQASLISAYAFLDNSYKEYRSKLKELYGEEAHQNITDAIAAEKCKDVTISAPAFLDNCVLELENNPGGPQLFYDEFSKRYFETTIEKLMSAEYHLNRNLALRGYVVVNEFYDFLGLDHIDGGEEIGWSLFNDDGMNWIDFNHRKTVINDDLECYIVEMFYYPRRGFSRRVKSAKKTRHIMRKGAM